MMKIVLASTPLSSNDSSAAHPTSRNLPEIRSPMEAHGSFRGDDWSPERLMFHQNLETFAEKVGLIVGLQANGKLSQDQAFAQIKKIWKGLKQSKESLITNAP